LGPGLLESAYQACLAYELRDRAFDVTMRSAMPDAVWAASELKRDTGSILLVDDCIIVENKSVQAILQFARRNCHLSKVVGPKTGVSGQLERATHQGWHQTNGQ